jgi:hypothetical protein
MTEFAKYYESDLTKANNDVISLIFQIIDVYWKEQAETANKW